MNRTIKSGLLGLVAAIVGGVLLCSAGAKADTFDFTMAGGGFSIDSVLTASRTGAFSWSVDGVSGTVTTGGQSFAISSLLGVNGYPNPGFSVSNGNIVDEYFINPAVYGFGQGAAGGIGFVANGVDFWIYLQGGDSSTYHLLDNNGADVLGTGDVTATPLPSTWAMLLAALVGLGFLVFRGTKTNTVALAAA